MGLGVALLSKLAVQEECERGELMYLPIANPPVRYLQVIYHADLWMKVILEDFVKMIESIEIVV